MSRRALIATPIRILLLTLAVGCLLVCHVPTATAQPNNGTLPCGSRFSPPVGAGGPGFDLLTGDFNEDGLLDLLTVSARGEIGICAALSKGDGSLEKVLSPVEAGESNAAAAGDVNGDGHLDVVVGVGSPGARVLVGNGSGRFTDSGFTIPNPPDPWSLELADFDRDGDLDLVAAGRNTDSLAVLRGRGDGSFDPPDHYPPHVSGLLHPVVSDLDHDGLPDIVAADATGRGASVLLGLGNATFKVLPRVDPPGVRLIREFEVADWNGDGHPDLVVSAETPGLYEYLVSTLLGTGTGSFVPGPVYRDNLFLPEGMAAGDVDQDGWLDLVLSDWRREQTLFLRGLGDGSFALADSVGYNYRGTDNQLLDLNQDGQLDLATALISVVGTHINVGLPVEGDVVITPRVVAAKSSGETVQARVTPPPEAGIQPLLSYSARLGGAAPLESHMGTSSEGWLNLEGGAYHLKFAREAFTALGPGEHRLEFGGCLGNWRGIRGVAVLKILPAHPDRQADRPLARLRSIPGRIPVEITWDGERGPGAESALVFDVRGRLVTRLAEVPGAPEALSWDGRSATGTPAPAGIYFIRLGTGSDTEVIKALLVR